MIGVSAGWIGCDSGDTTALPTSTTSCQATEDVFCNGVCVNTSSDPRHCGACDNVCLDGLSCVDSMCVVSGCGEMMGESLCDGECINTLTNGDHCGACNTQCGGESRCTNGECICSEGLSYCNGACVNYQNDKINCGQCLNSCQGDQVCYEGACRSSRDEFCNGMDDDLDSLIDEDAQGNTIRVDCSNLCGPGERVCERGEFGECSAPTSVMEICDMMDNDCDGLADEGVSVTYYEDRDGDGHGGIDPSTALVSCSPPSQRGPNGGLYVTSNRDCNDDDENVYPNAAEVCDNKDNNCDETIDEGCVCGPGDERTCGSNVGLCGEGTQQCEDGVFGMCSGAGYVAPTAEICDQQDQDCDGKVDEELMEDPFESSPDHDQNDRCDSTRNIGVSESGQSPVVVDRASLYHSDLTPDVDWYQITSTDDVSLCVPGRGQCVSFTLDFIHPPDVDGEDYEICIHQTSSIESNDLCDNIATFCTSEAEFSSYDSIRRTHSIYLNWDGTCGFDDSRFFNIEVLAPTGVNSCNPYTLRLRTDIENSGCPDPEEE